MIKERILIVDDNVGFCNTLQKILTKFGYESEIAHSRGEALNYLKKDISLFLLDIGLPGSDEEGLDLLKEIKAYKPMASVVMITGNQNYDFLVQCISAGASDFFIKSKLDVDYIKTTIEREFEKRRNWLCVMKNIKERTLSDFDDEIIKVSTFNSAFIDDEPQFLEMLKKVSSKLHMNSDFYTCSSDLLESKVNYQLLFVDLWLKGSELNGIDLIKELKSKNPFSDIVVVSGDLSPDTMALCSEFGVCDYIHKKNFDPYAVMDIIDRSESKFERWLKDQPKIKKYISH